MNFLRESTLDKSNLTADFVPSVRKPQYNDYDNKKLKNWSCDNFANYIFDYCDADGNFVNRGNETEFLNNYPAIIGYLQCIPKEYARVYLYGVWLCLMEFVKTDTKTEA